MCGIAGLFHAEAPKPVDPARVERMCTALAILAAILADIVAPLALG